MLNEQQNSEPLGYQTSGEVASTTVTRQQNFLDTGAFQQEIKYDAENYAPYKFLAFDKFFERPVEIAKFAIVDGSQFENRYDVWNLWSLEPSVRAKIKNYAWVAGDLEITVKVTGSPFHSGRIMISYQPCDTRNTTLVNHLASLLAQPTWKPLVLNYLSQSHLVEYMNVNARTESKITAPFISPKLGHRLYNPSSADIGTTDSFVDFLNAGSLFVYSINPIITTSGASSAYVQIYARLVNYTFGPPTATRLALVTEAGKLDERKVGPIERITSRVAAITGMLTSAPTIGPYAMASSMAFGAFSQISSIFGWSKPIMEEKVSYIKARPFSNGAACIGESTSTPILVDPKKEVTLDPRAVGTNCDETRITCISSRESYLGTFTWSPSDTPMSTTLFVCRVTPQLNTIYSDVAADYHQPTAMSFAVQPFTWWRGSLTYRFEIVSNKFQNGSLFIAHEPNIYQAGTTIASPVTNKLNSRILDIGSSQNVKYCVRWTHASPWKRVMSLSNVQYNYSNVDFTTDVDNTHNGVLFITPFTALSGDGTSDVSINVYVSCDDLSVEVPTDNYLPTDRRLVTEAGKLDKVDDPSQDSAMTCFDVTPAFTPGNIIYNEYFGESVPSFGLLLKRSATTGFNNAGAAAPPAKARVTAQIVPPPYPAYGSVLSGPVLQHLPGYLRYAFLGFRGSIRKRLHFHTDGDVSRYGMVGCFLDVPSTTNALLAVAYSANPARRFFRGTASTIPSTNAGLDFELPWYSSNRFGFSCADDLVGANGTADADDLWYRNYIVDAELSETVTALEVEESSSFGDDASFMHFLGAPFFRVT